MLTIMVIARAIRIYRMVATDRDPRMAMGRSRLGFLACAEQRILTGVQAHPHCTLQ